MTVTHPRPQGRAATTPAQALARARDHLLGLQDPQGWWKGELETNVTMDAEDLLLREFLRIRTRSRPRRRRAGSRRSSARTAPGPTSTAGPPTCPPRSRPTSRCGSPATSPAEPHMARAAACIRARGGIAATRVFTRIWLALFGEWPWEDLPVMPPELIYLPTWFPLNVYDWACWARQTIVPLTIVGSLRPVRPLPFTLNELAGPAPSRVTRPAGQAGPTGRGPGRGGRRCSAGSTGCCTGTSAAPTGPRRCGRCAARHCAGARNGSSRGRRRTAAGAASSRRGCTR